MPADVVVPTLGLGRSSGHIAEWYLADGAHVDRGELVYRYESDFVAFDVEAESDGVLRHRLETGARPLQGSVVAVIYAPGEPEHEPNEAGWRRSLRDTETNADAHTVPADDRPEGHPAPRLLSWPTDRERAPVSREGQDDADADEQEHPHEPPSRAFIFRSRRDQRRDDPPESRTAGRLGWITSSDDEEEQHEEEVGRWPGEPPRSEGDRGVFAWPQLDRRQADDEARQRTVLGADEPAVEEHEPPQASAWQEPDSSASAPPAERAGEADRGPATVPETRGFVWDASDEPQPAIEAQPVYQLDDEPAAAGPLAPELEPEEEDAWWEQSETAATSDVQPDAATAEGPTFYPREAAFDFESPAERLGSDAPLGLWQEEAPVERERAPETQAAIAADAPGMPPASFRVEVDLGESARLRDALADASGESASGMVIEDFILRAIAMTIAEWWRTEGDESIAVVRPARDGDDIRMVQGAARLAIAEIAAARQEPEAASGDACACVVFLLSDCGLDEGFALPEGHAFAFSVGRVREVVAFDGRSIIAAPVATLTVVYRPHALPLGDAASMLGNIRRLLEQPDALACEWRPLD